MSSRPIVNEGCGPFDYLLPFCMEAPCLVIKLARCWRAPGPDGWPGQSRPLPAAERICRTKFTTKRQTNTINGVTFQSFYGDYLCSFVSVMLHY